MFKMFKNLFYVLFYALEESSTAEGNNGGSEAGSEQGNNNTAVAEFEIDGEKLTADQIREFKKGYLRQSDYTKKTTALAQEKANNSAAIDFYEKYKENPALIKQVDPSAKSENQIADPKVDILSHQVFKMQLERQVESIMEKDPDVDVLALLDIAKEKKIGIDDAYDLYKGRNFESFVKKVVKENNTELTEEIKKNGIKTTTVIKPNESKVTKPTLTAEQKAFAQRYGMTDEEYLQYGSRTYNPLNKKK